MREGYFFFRAMEGLRVAFLTAFARGDSCQSTHGQMAAAHAALRWAFPTKLGGSFLSFFAFKVRYMRRGAE